MATEFEFETLEGELVYSSMSPEDTRRTSGRRCGISFYRNPDGESWTVVFQYAKSNHFTTSAVLKYDMPAHFLVDFSVVSHCALIETLVGIHERLVAAWGLEISKFTSAVAENHWKWDQLGSK